MMLRAIFITWFAGVAAVGGWAQARTQLPPGRVIAEPAVRAEGMRDAATQAALSSASGEAPAGQTVAPKETEASPAAQKTLAGASPFSTAGKRDPFRSVIQSHETGTNDCAAGKKCLVANLLILKGVVKEPDGMLAVVENQHHKSYFLRENDPVFNGQVVRITSDSIVFREKVADRTGHEKTQEVVKYIAGGKPAA
jgi:Tfp pilus assembly protein PilP